MLEQAGLKPQKMFGQNFLIDHNLLARLVELAGVHAGDCVLEVGPGTGVLTEQLLAAGAEVLAVEIDRGMAQLLASRLSDQPGMHLMNADVLAGKHAINPQVLTNLGQLAGQSPGRAVRLVSNLPYSIATPLVCDALLSSLAAQRGDAQAMRFDSLAFTVQREVADRFAASQGDEQYGPVSVLIALLGRCQMGPVVPPESFWPRPAISSRMMRIDFQAPSLQSLPEVSVLSEILTMTFSQRRKKIGSAARRSQSRFSPEVFAEALQVAGISPDLRPEQVSPAAFAALAAELAKS